MDVYGFGSDVKIGTFEDNKFTPIDDFDYMELAEQYRLTDYSHPVSIKIANRPMEKALHTFLNIGFDIKRKTNRDIIIYNDDKIIKNF